MNKEIGLFSALFLDILFLQLNLLLLLLLPTHYFLQLYCPKVSGKFNKEISLKW